MRLRLALTVANIDYLPLGRLMKGRNVHELIQVRYAAIRRTPRGIYTKKNFNTSHYNVLLLRLLDFFG